MKNFRELLGRSVEKYGNCTAFIKKEAQGRSKKITYFEFYYEIKSLSHILRQLDKQTEKVGILSENRYEWCVSYLATAISGKQIYPLDKELKEKELENLLIDSNISTLIFSGSCREVALRVFEKKKTKIRYLIDLDCAQSTPSILSYEQLLRKGRYLQNYQTEEEVFDGENQPSVILYTSGTTGKPKAVMLSQKNICFNLEQIAKRVPINKKDHFHSLLPLHHTYECTLGFLFPISRGACISFSKGYRSLYQEFQEEKPTVFTGVPLLCEKIDRKIQKRMQFPKANEKKVTKEILGGNMKMIFSGAAVLDQEVTKRFYKRAIPIYQVYGMTECSPVITLEGPYQHEIGSIGKVVFGGELQIQKEGESPIGEICYRGQNVMIGYQNDQEKTNEIIDEEGWIHTGDLGLIDKKGYLHFMGRKKNVIILRNGETVYPEELEQKINRIKEVKESIVYEKNSQIIACLVLKEKYCKEKQIKEKLEQEIKKLNQEISDYKRIQKIEIKYKEFEKTSTSKIKRKIIAQKEA